MMLAQAAACLLLLLAGTPAAEPALPESAFAAGWAKAGPELRFEEQDLFGHINGGAELFLEFGFEELRVQSYDKGDAELTLEVYRMDGPAAALGIYLLRCGRETSLPELEARNSGNRYQLTLVKGSRFIQVNSFQGDEALLPDMAALAADLLAALPAGEPVRLFTALPRRDLVPGSERILRGPYALQPVFTFGPGDMLQLGGKVYAVMADYRSAQEETYTRIVIDYPSGRDAEAVFTDLRERLDPGLKLLAEREGWFSFRDRRDLYGAADMRGARLTLMIHLTDPPEQTGDR